MKPSFDFFSSDSIIFFLRNNLTLSIARLFPVTSNWGNYQVIHFTKKHLLILLTIIQSSKRYFNLLKDCTYLYLKGFWFSSIWYWLVKEFTPSISKIYWRHPTLTVKTTGKQWYQDFWNNYFVLEHLENKTTKRLKLSSDDVLKNVKTDVTSNILNFFTYYQ